MGFLCADPNSFLESLRLARVRARVAVGTVAKARDATRGRRHRHARIVLGGRLYLAAATR